MMERINLNLGAGPRVRRWPLRTSISRLGLSVALLIFMSSGSSFAAGVKPEPTGIYDLLFGAPGSGYVTLDGNPCLDNPNIDGYRFKTGWAKIQPDNADEYKWDQIDAVIATAAAHGKKLCISIAGGTYTPDWVYTTAPVVYKYAIKETENGVSIGNQPLPWDTAYQAKWAKFVAAFAARYDSNPACSYIVMGGFMQVFNMTLGGVPEDETAMAALAENPPPGYPGLTTAYPDLNSAYLPAAKAVIGMYMTSFVSTPAVITLAKVFPSDAGTQVQFDVRDWGLATYPNRFGTMVSALYATVPPHAPPPVPILPFPKGFQMVCRTSDSARLYIDPDPVPMPAAPIPLQDALENGVSRGAKYVEVYEEDLVAPESQPVLAAERVKLKANAPADGAPEAPKNLRIP